jgi:hypothetical protein
VIDVKSGVGTAAVDELVDERFERGLLFLRRHCPLAAVDCFAVRPDPHPAEEILTPAVRDKRITFEIEEDVPGIRLWK